MAQSFTKDPDAVLDYSFDWTSWLESNETINVATIAADTGATVDSSSIASGDKSVVAWISGGTAGTNYNVTCHIVTSQGREDDRTIRLMVRQR